MKYQISKIDRLKRIKTSKKLVTLLTVKPSILEEAKSKLKNTLENINSSVIKSNKFDEAKTMLKSNV